MAEPYLKKHRLDDDDKDHGQGSGKFQAEWVKLFPGIVEVSKKGLTHAFCKACNKDIKVVASGLYDLKHHFKW